MKTQIIGIQHTEEYIAVIRKIAYKIIIHYYRTNDKRKSLQPFNHSEISF